MLTERLLPSPLLALQTLTDDLGAAPIAIELPRHVFDALAFEAAEGARFTRFFPADDWLLIHTPQGTIRVTREKARRRPCKGTGV